jgi:Transposase DDE domain
MINIFGLFLSIKGRINFLQLERFSKMDEQSFRNQFEVKFDFAAFNKELILEHGSGHYGIAFDPSYISKVGKQTPGVGYFWSGTAAKTKWGLEIGGIAVVDIDNHTAFHLEAVQTLDVPEAMKMLDFYAKILVDRKIAIQSLSKYILVDAYFSKKPFVSKLTTNGYHVISRMRDDAHLIYKFNGEQKTGRGRPKKHGDKVNFKALQPDTFELVEDNKQVSIFTGMVYSKALEVDIKVVIVYRKKKGKSTHKTYFSTDMTLDWHQILDYYKMRFQIEFLYRDGKQHTGLNDCQARSEKKMDFHFNLALTSINIAKTAHWLTIPKQNRGAFSMADVKTLYNNELMISRFISMFGINPNTTKNKDKISQLLAYGKIAA